MMTHCASVLVNFHDMLGSDAILPHALAHLQTCLHIHQGNDHPGLPWGYCVTPSNYGRCVDRRSDVLPQVSLDGKQRASATTRHQCHVISHFFVCSPFTIGTLFMGVTCRCLWAQLINQTPYSFFNLSDLPPKILFLHCNKGYELA
jgi:hypothetical protein